MRKKGLVLVILAMFALFLFGCTKEEGSGEFTLIVENLAGEEIVNDTISFTKDDTLLELLQAHEETKVKGEESSFGFYISEVAGIKSDSTNYWSIEINGEYALVGVSEIQMKDQDVIKLVLVEITF